MSFELNSDGAILAFEKAPAPAGTPTGLVSNALPPPPPSRRIFQHREGRELLDEDERLGGPLDPDEPATSPHFHWPSSSPSLSLLRNFSPLLGKRVRPSSASSIGATFSPRRMSTRSKCRSRPAGPSRCWPTLPPSARSGRCRLISCRAKASEGKPRGSQCVALSVDGLGHGRSRRERQRERERGGWTGQGGRRKGGAEGRWAGGGADRAVRRAGSWSISTTSTTGACTRSVHRPLTYSSPPRPRRTPPPICR